MKITRFEFDPITSIPFLNAGKRPGDYFIDHLPVHLAVCDAIPNALDAIVATADLQGRECFASAAAMQRKRPAMEGLRLLGEIVPQLICEILTDLGLRIEKSGAVLAGDFYTYPDLHGRGGTGDVTEVWNEFSKTFRWVIGVAGNHDTFGDRKSYSASNAYFLDGHRKLLDDIPFAGISGIVGNPKRNFRKTHEEYVEMIETCIVSDPQILVTHDGPSFREKGGLGIDEVRFLLESHPIDLVIRGHAHWSTPFVELETGTQILNVDQRIVVLVRDGDL